MKCEYTEVYRILFQFAYQNSYLIFQYINPFFGLTCMIQSLIHVKIFLKLDMWVFQLFLQLLQLLYININLQGLKFCTP